MLPVSRAPLAQLLQSQIVPRPQDQVRSVPRTDTQSWLGITSLGGSRDRCGAVKFPVFLGVLSRHLWLRVGRGTAGYDLCKLLRALRESKATAQVSPSPLRGLIRFPRSVLVVGPETFLQEKLCQENVGLPTTVESGRVGEFGIRKAPNEACKLLGIA